MHGNDEVRSHFANHVGGQIIDKTTVDKNLVAPAHWRKDPGNGHCGPHRVGKRAVLEDVGFAGNDFRSNTAKGDRKVVERWDRRIRQRFAVDQEANLMPRVQPRGEVGTVLKADLNRVRNFPGIFLAPEREIRIRGSATKQDRPIGVLNNFVQLIGRLTRSVKASNEATHTCARQVINGDVVLFEPFKDANMRLAQRPSPLQRDTDKPPFVRGWFRVWARLSSLPGLSRLLAIASCGSQKKIASEKTWEQRRMTFYLSKQQRGNDAINTKNSLAMD